MTDRWRAATAETCARAGIALVAFARRLPGWGLISAAFAAFVAFFLTTSTALAMRAGSLICAAAALVATICAHFFHADPLAAHFGGWLFFFLAAAYGADVLASTAAKSASISLRHIPEPERDSSS